MTFEEQVLHRLDKIEQQSLTILSMQGALLSTVAVLLMPVDKVTAEKAYALADSLVNIIEKEDNG